MTSFAVPKTNKTHGPYDPVERQRILARLVAEPHPEGATDGIPYYDKEFDMPQSFAHGKTIHYLIELLNQVADRVGLETLSDNPVWYWNPWEDRRQIVYPDYALATPTDLGSVTARSLRLVLEVVSIERVEKERKDSERMRLLNEFNGVPEFLLVYPELADGRSLVWYRYDGDRAAYERVPLSGDRRYQSLAIPGLEIEVLEPGDWSLGRKVRAYHLGQEVRDVKAERQAREREQQAREREQQAREAAERQAEEERQAREAAEGRVLEALAEQERLRALLKQAGIEPE